MLLADVLESAVRYQAHITEILRSDVQAADEGPRWPEDAGVSEHRLRDASQGNVFSVAAQHSLGALP